jgi:hypothetical protein
VLAQSGGSYLNRRLACQALAEFRAAAREPWKRALIDRLLQWTSRWLLNSRGRC